MLVMSVAAPSRIILVTHFARQATVVVMELAVVMHRLALIRW